MTYQAETLDAAQAEIVRLQAKVRDLEDVRILLGIEDEEQIREAVQQVIDEREMLQSAYDEGQEEVERLRSNWTRDQAALALARDEIERLRGDLELSRRGEAYQMREHDAAQAAVEEKDAEIERLRAELEEEAGIMRALRRHRDEAEAELRWALQTIQEEDEEANAAEAALALAQEALRKAQLVIRNANEGAFENGVRVEGSPDEGEVWASRVEDEIGAAFSQPAVQRAAKLAKAQDNFIEAIRMDYPQLHNMNEWLELERLEEEGLRPERRRAEGEEAADG